MRLLCFRILCADVLIPCICRSPSMIPLNNGYAWPRASRRGMGLMPRLRRLDMAYRILPTLLSARYGSMTGSAFARMDRVILNLMWLRLIVCRRLS